MTASDDLHHGTVPFASSRLDGRVAIVTGGGAGLGYGIALALAGAGAIVAIADIVPERCTEVVGHIAAIGGTALALPTDMVDTAQVRDMVAACHACYGRVDVLVNNVGGVSGRPFLAQSERSWRRHIDLNLMSLLAATSATAPLIAVGGRGGSIINVASIEAIRAAPGYAVYAACKAAMVSFTRTMAVELAEHRIRVNAITPDYIETPGLRGNVTGPVDPATWAPPDAGKVAAMERRVPLGPTGTAADVGNAALFLASDMGRYVTGATLPVDGGSAAALGWARTGPQRWSL